MKKSSLAKLILVLTSTSCHVTSTSSPAPVEERKANNSGVELQNVWLGEYGDAISSSNFQRLWSVSELNIYRWNYTDSTSKRKIGRLFKGQYITLLTDYKRVKHKIEEITSQAYPDSFSFVINYNFLNDNYTGKVNKTNMDLKIFETSPYKEAHNQLLKNKENIIKNMFFHQSEFCSSRIAIKPNGEVLLNNGEAIISHFIEYLELDYWPVFFPN